MTPWCPRRPAAALPGYSLTDAMIEADMDPGRKPMGWAGDTPAPAPRGWVGAAVKLMWLQSLCLVMGVTGVSPWLSPDPGAGKTRWEVRLPNVSHCSVSHFER